MFYKHARLEKKLREHGRAAPAEILAMRTEGGGSSIGAVRATDDDLTAQWTLCWLHLRVMPEGEPQFEVNVRTRLNTFKYKGDVVPVLYDPDDHDKVFVDYEADVKATMERYERGRQTAAAARTAGQVGDVAQDAAAFAEEAAEFRKQAAGFRAVGETLQAIGRAKAAGDTAEVARLKAEFQQRAGEQGTGGTP